MIWLDRLLRQRQPPRESAAAPEPRLTRRNARVDLAGNAVIPAGTEVIEERAFENRSDLRRVQVPASVREIGNFAFAKCGNLTRVQLSEGLETLGAGVFSGCGRLKELALPDSLREVSAGSFSGLALPGPLFNRDRTVLYRYFGPAGETRYAVPGSVRRLAPGAFSEDSAMEEVLLPPRLQTIDSLAFFTGKLRRITLPASLWAVQDRAFWRCGGLEELEILCGRHVLQRGMLYRCGPAQIRFRGQPADFELELHLRGGDLLARVSGLSAPPEDFWEDRRLAALAAGCAAGDARAMWELAEELQARNAAPFDAFAANFWRYRACQYGSPQAAAWKARWLAEHPRERIPAPMGSALAGSYSGALLRAMGFRFFDPARSYSLDGVDRNGLVEVSSWCGEDGPDEDGFGREEYYDWWLLDEYLQEIPGISVIADCSHRDKQVSGQTFSDRYQAAVKALRSRRGK